MASGVSDEENVRNMARIGYTPLVPVEDTTTPLDGWGAQRLYLGLDPAKYCQANARLAPWPLFEAFDDDGSAVAASAPSTAVLEGVTSLEIENDLVLIENESL